MGRVLGVDLGARRTGVALSDPLGLTAQGCETLEGRSTAALLADLEKLARREEVERVVVGLPLDMSGDEGFAAARARRFAAELAARLGLPVELWDERLTTVQAERALVGGRVRRGARRGRRDRIAAILILQSWLDAQRLARETT